MSNDHQILTTGLDPIAQGWPNPVWCIDGC